MGLRSVCTGAAAGLAMAALGAMSSASAETLNALFMAQAAYSDSDVKAMTAAFEKDNPGVTVNLEFVPYEALYDKIVASKAAGGAGYDVVLYDVIWPAAFAQNNVLVDVTDRLKGLDRSQIFDGAWATVDYDGKTYGMPWILDTKYLFYNTEMLKKAGIAAPPKTWEELAKDAKIIKDKGIVQYPIVWSWSQAEAVICDYVTIAAAYGGKFFDDGKPAFDKGGSLDALKYMVQTLKDGVSNPNSKEYLEEDVRKVFSAGDAAFALNWTYMYGKANDPAESKVVGKVGVEPAPGVEGKTAASAVNGSMALGITAGSSKVDLAWKYIAYLTSKPVQDKYAQLSLPIWKASYTDPAVTKGQEPLVQSADVAIGLMTPRPMVASYQELSTILQTQIQNALAGKATPEDALAAAAKDAARIR
ncbi:multiple sugar transport system substrate-binding protein [Labrys monachus]|uniref:Multiple sugar transport system substrate-binding protein n=2 Tax=Labrys monachus TaxID=217067 RepID=A0ABU0FCJ5_9HYPH|nr:multiple sugar transport system substrate-binding protein [Labrys monachus]